MKVDLGTCAVCGAKNSKFVEACYKCGAALPWAPGYVAPKAQEPKNAPSAQPSQPAAPQAQSTPQPTTPPNNEAKTVVSPPINLSTTETEKAPLQSSISERANRRVTVPTWAIGAGVLGCIAFGVALMLAFGNRNSPNPTVVPAVVVETATPAAAETASTTPSSPTVAATAIATMAPTANPAMTPSVAATTAPTVAATEAASLPLPAPVRVGPSFDEINAKMDDKTNGLTQAQKQTYLQGVTGSTIRWRGVIVDVRLTGGGEVSLRCGKQTVAADVLAKLDGTQTSLLSQLNKGETVTIEGILESYSTTGYTISQAKIADRS